MSTEEITSTEEIVAYIIEGAPVYGIIEVAEGADPATVAARYLDDMIENELISGYDPEAVTTLAAWFVQAGEGAFE